jgi:hypothetical protein
VGVGLKLSRLGGAEVAYCPQVSDPGPGLCRSGMMGQRPALLLRFWRRVSPGPAASVHPISSYSRESDSWILMLTLLFF